MIADIIFMCICLVILFALFASMVFGKMRIFAISTLILMITGFSALIITQNDSYRAAAIYNNGIHVVDGGHWYLEVTNNWHFYYEVFYKCDKCGKVLKTRKLISSSNGGRDND